MKGYKKKTKLDDYIMRETGFTLLRCDKCGDFYDKHGKPHVCREHNSMKLCTTLIKENEQ